MAFTMREGVGLLLIGGDGPQRRDIQPVLAVVTCTIAADSGFDLALALGLEPDLLVGDLDSVRSSEALRRFPQDRIRRYPRDKAETDAEIAFRTLGELGFAQRVIAGGGGGRLDHLLGILALFQREEYPKAWYTAKELVQVVEGEQILSGCSGQTVSFFPLTERASGLSSLGLKWPLDGLCWARGDMGISNVIEQDHCVIRVDEGRLLMVRTIAEEWDARKNKA